MLHLNLPALGQPLEGGIFAGLSTTKAGKHCAVVLLPGQGKKLTWDEAKVWAAKRGGELPTRPVAALIFANVSDRPTSGWHWTSEEDADDASYAWGCYYFGYGRQGYDRKIYESSAVCVRMIPFGGEL